MRYYLCAYCKAEVNRKDVHCPKCGKDIWWRKIVNPKARFLWITWIIVWSIFVTIVSLYINR